jgi:hypothetical protein
MSGTATPDEIARLTYQILEHLKILHLRALDDINYALPIAASAINYYVKADPQELQATEIGGTALQVQKSFYGLSVSAVQYSQQNLQLIFDKEFINLRAGSGETANLAYFCCAARDEILRPGQTREIELIYEWPSGWSRTVERTYFSIRGFEQVIFVEWEITLPRLPVPFPALLGG